jgi:hypothetical protein
MSRNIIEVINNNHHLSINSDRTNYYRLLHPSLHMLEANATGSYNVIARVRSSALKF